MTFEPTGICASTAREEAEWWVSLGETLGLGELTAWSGYHEARFVLKGRPIVISGALAWVLDERAKELSAARSLLAELVARDPVLVFPDSDVAASVAWLDRVHSFLDSSTEPQEPK